ncbi:hypothetical protein [Parafrankia sp. BMG5.11]|uniref:hypothetical protein n=1 Tax=Parafrankia sp. BMG5.11 TaxID=222540 RepID=UPI00103FB2E0|nr:hypothetical protein [Parafrankia sp. BMG5.11]TCJ39259.1 hypothetical protein E0504_08940 [Parafrankia sp. BMG5.11]
MSNDVAAFIHWANNLAERACSFGEINIVRALHSSNPSAYIDVEGADGGLGRLQFHERGGAVADAFDSDGNQIDLTIQVQSLGGWEEVETENFDAAFAPFTSLFLRNGNAG